MPRVSIAHSTTYRYGAAVSLGPHRLMLRPRDAPDIRLIAFKLDISPTASVNWSHDVAGNAIASASFGEPSDLLSIRSRAVVDLTAPAWPVFSIDASATRYPFLYDTDDHRDLGALSLPQYADDAGRLRHWAEALVLQTPTDSLSLLKDVANAITTRIVYRARDLEGTQGPLETLNRGSGSCRDFAVLFAEAVRTLGFGARIVSGYLYDPDMDRFGSAGTGSTHAWVDVFLGGAGWVPFDPTNRAVGSANLIPVAVARRIEQIAPVSGSFRGEGVASHPIEVSVYVTESIEA